MSKEVVASNFEQLCPEIFSRIKNSDFIAIDAEFSGISTSYLSKYSLFDTADDRYLAVRDNIKDFAIIQYGITAFNFKRVNSYFGSRYVFYIFKMPTGISQIDTIITYQNDAVGFLAEHKFDFNKVMYQGISYMNILEEKELVNFNASKNGIISPEMKKLVEEKCAEVGKWLQIAKKGTKFVLFNKINYTNRILAFLTVKQIQVHFPTVKISEDSSGQVTIKAPGITLRDVRTDVSSHTTFEKTFVDKGTYIEDCIGFSKIFKLLVALKKPIVGHNILLDIMLMYHQFHQPLPYDYKTFKAETHDLFPVLYDTKFLSYELRSVLSYENKWESNELCQLYQYFKDGQGIHLVQFSPDIQLADSGDLDSPPSPDEFHEAGWDSYCAGYCFIRIMHYFAMKKYLDSKLEPHSLVVQQHLHAVKQYANRINVIQAQIKYMCLEGPDPKSSRPQWVVVTSKSKDKVDSDLLNEYLAKVQGQIDIRMLSDNKVLIAISSSAAFREIVATLEALPDWKVSTFNPYRDEPWMNVLSWVVITAGVCTVAYITMKMVQKQM